MASHGQGRPKSTSTVTTTTTTTTTSVATASTSTGAMVMVPPAIKQLVPEEMEEDPAGFPIFPESTTGRQEPTLVDLELFLDMNVELF